MMYEIENYQKCSCGAITLFMENGEAYSCKQKNLRKFFPSIDLRKIERLPDLVLPFAKIAMKRSLRSNNGENIN